MQIKCPECGFTREVNESQVPANSSFATCPKCATRFRFRAEPDNSPEYNDLTKQHPDVDDTHENSSDLEQDSDKKKPEDEDIWASMEKMRHDWEEIDREENIKTDEKNDDATRREAQKAYQQAAAGAGGHVPFFSTLGSVPWEYRGGFLNPIVLVRTILLMVSRTPQFFSGVNPFSSIIPAWVFLMLVRGVQMIAAILSTQLVETLPDGTQNFLSIYDVFDLPTLIAIIVCMITIMHFLGSFIVNYTIQLHSRPKANFRLTFKVMAYANMPIMLSVIPGVGNMLGVFASLLLLFFGIRYAYAFSWRKTMISIAPYLILSMLFVMVLLQAVAGGA